MGNREDLLAAARQCLYERGYARTTARDIAGAAGVSLAAIGYHFGTKEQLLNAAVVRALQEWGDGLAGPDPGAPGPDATPAERFTAAWTRVLRGFADNRPLWSMQFELLAHLDRHPELRQSFAEASRQGRRALVELFGDFGHAADEAAVLRLGALYQALLAGLAARWLADPGAVADGRELAEALRLVGAELDVEHPPGPAG